MNSGSDNESGWANVNVFPNYEAYQQTQQPQNAAIFNPSQTLHLRTNSDSGTVRITTLSSSAELRGGDISLVSLFSGVRYVRRSAQQPPQLCRW